MRPARWCFAILLAHIPTSYSASPFTACGYARVWAADAIDTARAGAPKPAVLQAAVAANKQNKNMNEGVPDLFVARFVEDVYSGRYRDVPQGNFLFDARDHEARFKAECVAAFAATQ